MIDEGLYGYINDCIATVLRFLDDGTAARVMRDGSALALKFWETNAAVAQGISVAQIASAMLSAIFVFCIVVAIMKKKALTASPSAESSEVVAGSDVPPESLAKGGALRERWDEILTHLNSPREAEWKMAVLEADKLVDDALGKAGFSGASFGDRLTNIQPGTLVSLDGLWWAHKVRNRLAHEMDYFLRYTEARQAISYYEQALTELQLL
jgi:hypothetical protein